jgi:hypothetical protein
VQQQDGVKAAYFGFLDRYRALPGDYAGAVGTIANVSTAACNGGNGNGNGQIATGDDENTLAWEHLSKSGFISGTYVCAAAVSAATSPSNPYGQFLNIVFDGNYADATASPSRHNLKTGAAVPSDILAEMDRKIDDGDAVHGSFRAQLLGGVAATTTDCYSAAGVWVASPGGPNCGGASLF